MPHLELSLVDSASRRTARHDATRHDATPDDAARDDAAPDEATGRAPAPVPNVPRARPAPGSLERWAAAVTEATEPSLVVDADAVIVTASVAGAELLGLRDGLPVCGRQLRDAVVNLVDFTDSLDRLDRAEADKIPPLLAISSGQLARGLMRFRCPETKRVATMDAVATPLRQGTTVVGSLTFFSRI